MFPVSDAANLVLWDGCIGLFRYCLRDKPPLRSTLRNHLADRTEVSEQPD